jgi:hypothetical protein
MQYIKNRMLDRELKKGSAELLILSLLEDPATSRLRPQQAHRSAIGRHPEIPRRLALPAALSTREARLDPWALD